MARRLKFSRKEELVVRIRKAMQIRGRKLPLIMYDTKKWQRQKTEAELRQLLGEWS